MDVHIVPGVKAHDVAQAHTADLFHQDEYRCKCMTYWVDEARETVFCLIDAPSKEAVVDLHSKAHGLVPNKIIEVNSNLVESFLGRIYDPSDAKIDNDGLKVFSDPSFRVIVRTKTEDPVLLQHQLGIKKADELLTSYYHLVRSTALRYSAREIENGGQGFILSFTSAADAISFALSVAKELRHEDADALSFRMSITGGEPVGESNELFGDSLKTAEQLWSLGECRLAMTSSVKKLVDKMPVRSDVSIRSLNPQDETLLASIFRVLEANWQDPEFDVEEYCQEMAMSKSQLYRKTVSLTGHSPNSLLKEYRLEKARELMKKKFYNISQITFDTGFTSHSYFTKCFKKKYGLLPISYMELCQ